MDVIASKFLNDKGYVNFGGNGRYFYRIDPTTNASTVDVVDSTLCTAANYISAGSWTVNPIVATITLTAGKTYRAMAYNPDLEEVCAFSTDGTTVGVIDAKPSSGTFNTLLATLTISPSFGTGLQCALYSVHKKYFFVGTGLTLICWERTRNAALTSFPILSNQNMWFHINPHTGDILTCNTNPFLLIVRDIGEIGAPVLKNVAGNNNIPNPGFSLNHSDLIFGAGHNTQLNLYAQKYPDIRNFTENDFTALSGLSVTAMRVTSGNRVSTKQNKLFYSTTGLVTGFVNITNPRAIISITTHTRTAVSSETSASRLCLNGDETVLAIEPLGGTPQHMHIYDAVNNTYVGYVIFGKTGINDSTYTSPLICNRWLN